MTETQNPKSVEADRRIDVELFIVHPTMSAAEISAALGLDATFSHSVGETRKTPKGTVLPGVHRDTRWRHSIRHQLSGQWFADRITSLVQILVPHKAFLHQVRASGGTAQIIIQFFGEYFGDEVPLTTLHEITELKLDFGIEVFNIPQSGYCHEDLLR